MVYSSEQDGDGDMVGLGYDEREQLGARPPSGQGRGSHVIFGARMDMMKCASRMRSQPFSPAKFGSSVMWAGFTPKVQAEAYGRAEGLYYKN